MQVSLHTNIYGQFVVWSDWSSNKDPFANRREMINLGIGHLRYFVLQF